MPAYDGLQPITHDAHVHPANVSTVAELLGARGPYDPAQKCAHSYHWCDEVFDQARANGLDALIQSHHSEQVRTNPGGDLLDYWTQAGVDWQHPYGRQESYPTHPDGVPLLVTGGHTHNELEALWECAVARNEPGQFLALYGVEYTVGSASHPPCDQSNGSAQCGGHKVLIFRDNPGRSCSPKTWDGLESQCVDEGAAYALVEQTRGVAHAAHPTTNTGTTDWTPWNAGTAPGGMADTVVGYEFDTSREDVACVDDVAACGYRQVLARGFRVHPTYGSDNHHQFGATGTSCFADLGFSGNGPRGSCWAAAFTRDGLIDAMQAHRCFWTTKGDPSIQWTLAGAPMGSTLQLTPQTGVLELAVEIDRVDGTTFTDWELVRGDLSGGDGGATVVASGSCGPDTCSDSAQLPPDPHSGWYYLRISTGPWPVAVTAPIWTESIQSVPLLPGPALRLLLATLALYIVSRRRS